MDRRAALAVLGSAALLPRALAREKLKRVALVRSYLHGPTLAAERAEYAKGYEALGYRVGENLEIDWYELPVMTSRDALLESHLANLRRHPPDCIVAEEEFVGRLRKAAPTTPIVAQVGGDPVEKGYAASLQRPGGYVTGLHSGQREVAEKRIEILRAFVPDAKCVAWIAFSGQLGSYPAFEAAARKAGMRTRQVLLDRNDAPTFERQQRVLSRLPAEGCAAGHFQSAVPEAIEAVTQVARESRLALSYLGDYDRWQTEGLLFIYSARTRSRGQSRDEREAAIVSRILRGEKPGDIAFEGPTGYYFHVNGKTAAAIGRPIPPAIAIQADSIFK